VYLQNGNCYLYHRVSYVSNDTFSPDFFVRPGEAMTYCSQFPSISQQEWYRVVPIKDYTALYENLQRE
jgi:hypothetical protein